MTAPRARMCGDDWVFEVAGAEHDATLRELLRAQPIPGWVTLSYEREPNYFLAAGIEGDVHDTLLARAASDGRVVGMFAHSEREAFVNGRVVRLGYLGQLRLDPAYRNSIRRLRAGFEACHRLLCDRGRAPLHLTSIIESNARARRLLLAGLPGLPTYRELCRFSTLVLPTSQFRRRRDPRAGGVRRADAEELPEIVRLLQQCYRRYQCAPVWTAASLRSDSRCRDLEAEDFVLAERGGAPIGCAALWDQLGYKQHVVRGYDKRITRWRSLINLIAPAAGLPRLPAPGAALKQVYLSHIAVQDEDAEILVHLVRACGRMAAQRGYDSLVLGLGTGHPLREVITRRFRYFEYRSLLCAVYWEEGAAAASALDGRPVHVEVATL